MASLPLQTINPEPILSVFNTALDQSIAESQNGDPDPDFRFKEDRVKVNWRTIFSVNTEALIEKVDVNTLKMYLHELTYGNLDEETCFNCRNPYDPYILKYIRLLQLSMQQYDHYLKSLQHKQEHLLERQFAASRENAQVLDELKETVKANESVIQQLLNPAFMKSMTDECPYCGKRFATPAFLQCHLLRRHPEEFDHFYCSGKEIQDLTGENSRQKDQITGLQQELKANSSDNLRLKQDNSRQNNQITGLLQELTASRSDELDLKQETSRQKDQITGLEQELQTNRSDNQSLKQETSRQKDQITGLEQELQTNRSDNQSLKQETSRQKDQITGLEQELQANRSDNQSLKQETSRQKDQITGLEQELQANHSDNQSLKQETSRQKDQITGLEQELQASISSCENVKLKHKRVKEQVNMELECLYSNIESLKQETNKQQDQMTGLEQELKASISSCENVKLKHKRVKEQVNMELECLYSNIESLKQEKSKQKDQMTEMHLKLNQELQERTTKDLLCSALKDKPRSTILSRLPCMKRFKKWKSRLLLWEQETFNIVKPMPGHLSSCSESNQVSIKPHPSSVQVQEETQTMFGPERPETTKTPTKAKRSPRTDKTAAKNISHKPIHSTEEKESEDDQRDMKTCQPKKPQSCQVAKTAVAKTQTEEQSSLSEELQKQAQVHRHQKANEDKTNMGRERQISDSSGTKKPFGWTTAKKPAGGVTTKQESADQHKWEAGPGDCCKETKEGHMSWLRNEAGPKRGLGKTVHTVQLGQAGGPRQRREPSGGRQ